MWTATGYYDGVIPSGFVSLWEANDFGCVVLDAATFRFGVMDMVKNSYEIVSLFLGREREEGLDSCVSYQDVSQTTLWRSQLRRQERFPALASRFRRLLLDSSSLRLPFAVVVTH